MKLTENTKVRVKVPAHLYEAIQAELAKKEEMKEAISGKAEELKNFYEKVKEQVDGGTDLDSAISFVMNDLGMEMMEESMEEEHLNEFDPKYQAAMDFLNQIPFIAQIAKIDPFTAGMALVGMITGGTIAAEKIEKGIKALMAKIKDPKKKAELAAAAGKEGVKVGDGEAVQEVEEEVKEMEEALDLETLMEAVKDASKKKAEEKKKKEVEAKKKKEAEDKKKADEKKKKEAEAKKKADAKKK